MDEINGILKQLYTLGGLAGRKSVTVVKNAQSDASIAWARLWWKLVLVFMVFAVDAELKMHGFEHLVSWAMLVIPAFALLILGNPTSQVTWTTVISLIFHKERKTEAEGFIEFGFKRYWEFVATFILWTLIIAVGIKFIPIQYAPGAFWTFLPVFAINEIAFYKNWHSENARKTQRMIQPIAMIILALCLIIPFVMQAKSVMWEKYGYATPVEDTASAERNKLVYENEQLLKAKETDCIAKIHKSYQGKPLDQTAYNLIEVCSKVNKPYVTTSELPSSASKTGEVSTTSAGLMGQWDKFYQLKTTDPTLFWIILIAAHIPLIWLIKWAWTKWKDDETEVKKVESTSKSSAIPAILLTTIIAVGALYFLYEKGLEVQKARQTRALAYPAQTTVTTDAELGTWKARLTAVDNDPPFTDREFDVVFDKAFADRLNGVSTATTPVQFVFSVIGASDAGTYKMQNSACDMERRYDNGQMYSKCSGSWTNGTKSGTYDVVYNNTERNLYLSSDNGLIEMKLSQN